MNERRIIIIQKHKKGEKFEQSQIRLWQFRSRLYGFVGRQHKINIGDCLWYENHSRYSTPEKVLYLYPVEVIALGKGNAKVKVRFTDENGILQNKWVWSDSLRSEDR